MPARLKFIKDSLPYLSRCIGIAGVLLIIFWFSQKPSFPTPDKILLFLTFAFMALGQAKELLKRFLPFAALLFVYESFRGLATRLNSHVNFGWMPRVDKWLFGALPTKRLQERWWQGS